MKNKNKLKKINIITPLRKGGPWCWGQQLTEKINQTGQFEAIHKHKLFSLLSSPICQKTDIVHTTIPITFRLWKKPVILTLHGNYKQEKNIWQSMHPTAIKRADIVTVPSQYLKNELGIENALVIPNAVDVPTSIQRTDKNKINFLSIGNFYFKDKALGVLKIIDILNQLKKETRLDFEYHILGKGKYLEFVKNESKKYQLKNIFFEGFIDPKSYYSKTDIMLYYSDHDNMPLVIMEAMSYGIPVITNRVGAVNEMIDHQTDGYVAKNDDDYLEFFKKISLDSDLRHQLGQQAYQKIKDKFDWQVVIQAWLDVYSKQC